MDYTNWAHYMRVFVVLVLISRVSFSLGATDPRDVVAMNSLYVALGYPPLSGWLLVGGDPCGDKWEGVDCVFSNITAILLSGENLGGELGNSLDSFESIMTIDLSNNHIGGSIPSALPLTIRNFSLSGNQLSGSIPASLSLLTQLLGLSLNNNFLTGNIPDAFLQLTGLTYLDMSGNNLSGPLPPSMENLSSLTTLHLQNNKITGTLDVLQNLPLADLNIKNNLFSGPIPANLLSIPNFRKDGNPFNISVIATAPAPSPSHFAVAPSSEESPNRPANVPSSGSETYQLDGRQKFFTARRVTWIAIIVVAITILLGLCILVSRCIKGRNDRRNGRRRDNGAYKGSTSKYNQSSLQQINDEERGVPTEIVLKSQDRSGVDKRRMGFPPQLLDKQEMDVKTTTAASSTSMSGEFVPPPPPSPPFLVEKFVNPTFSALATNRRPTKSLNTSSIEVFSIARLQLYTDSFSQENFIGSGVLGSVYMAELPDGKLLAVKKLNSEASRLQSDEEFIELVVSISKIRHSNIVELVGYCSEHNQRILVYEYCKNGTLYDALNMDERMHQKLLWNMRIRVALGAARALEYLHELCQPPVMHRNFKSTNLLFDDKLEVHLSDCGLAPLLLSGSARELSGRLLTADGYGAPEFESGNYTYQSDVYSFGVIMLELLTGRKSCDRSRPRGEQYLVRWAIPQFHDIDALSRMVDPSLNGVYPIKSLSRFADIISSCLQREPEFRPPMSEIVEELLQMI